MATSDLVLPYLERLPKTGDPATAPLLILLHGRAARAETIFSIEGMLDPSLHILAIRGTYESPRDDFEWFLPYDYDHPLESFSEKHFQESEAILTRQIQAHLAAIPGSEDRLFLGGFSQGAAMCHILSLRGAFKPKGILPMSGFFPRPILNWPLPAYHSSYLITHGNNDTILPASESIYAYEFYRQHNIPAEYYEYNGRHKMTIPLIQKINSWIASFSSALP